MFRLIAATLAALYGILYVFGDESRRPEEVARAEPLGFELVSVAAMPVDWTPEPLYVSEVSDREAIDLALAAGKTIREERRAQPARPVALAAIEPDATETKEVVPAATYWYVTGSRVNLRQGPGTGNAVVTQLTLGTEAEVLDRQGGWVQIRTADGSVSGWMSGKFLVDKRPG